MKEHRTYTMMDVLSFVVLTAPRRLYEMLPVAALIGCLVDWAVWRATAN